MTFIAIASTLVIGIIGSLVGARFGINSLGAVLAVATMGGFILHTVGWNFDELKDIKKKLSEKDTDK